jgi:RNA polymerase sigma factor (TIGR02999 family)
MDESDDHGEITRLLSSLEGGGRDVLDRLVALLHDELHEIARRRLVHERSDHTLSATALVHEAWVRLAKQDRARIVNRSQFLGVAAIAMRRVLVNHAAARRATRRGGQRGKVTLSTDVAELDRGGDEVLAVDEALARLAAMDASKARIVELKFFGGLTTEEIAGVLAVSTATVERAWRFARAWLRNELERDDGDSHDDGDSAGRRG